MTGVPLSATVCDNVLVAPTIGGSGRRAHLSALSPSGKIAMTYLFILPVTIALLVCGLLYEVSAQPGQDQITVLVATMTTCIVALLFTPSRREYKNTWAKTMLADAAIITAVSALTVLVIHGRILPLFPFLKIASTCLLFIILGSSLLSMTTNKNESGRQFIIVTFLALAFAPVWLAPLIELNGNSPWLTNTVIAVSPISAFAVALDIDIMRTGWYYEHSSIGSLRYEYPSWGTTIIALFTLVTLSAMQTNYIQKRRAKA